MNPYVNLTLSSIAAAVMGGGSVALAMPKDDRDMFIIGISAAVAWATAIIQHLRQSPKGVNESNPSHPVG